jgi:undecaprenyl-diphosphatase
MGLLSAAEAVVLGVVEGVTEFLPISSTGHLVVTSSLLGLPEGGRAGDAVTSYEIAIQGGAILAVLVLYRHRLVVMTEGVLGRSATGRRLTLSVLAAFVPSALVAVISERWIKGALFGPWPVVAAWVVGGLAVLALTRTGRLGPQGGRALEAIGVREAAVIGAAQVLALWPGTSRALVTIVAALLVGLSMAAAVEFSFLLGFVTLGAATAYEAVRNGPLMVETFGWFTPLLGFAVAFASAALAIRWMVGYLTRHDLAIFGWYRIGIGVLTAALLVTGVL